MSYCIQTRGKQTFRLPDLVAVRWNNMLAYYLLPPIVYQAQHSLSWVDLQPSTKVPSWHPLSATSGKEIEDQQACATFQKVDQAEVKWGLGYPFSVATV